MTARRKPTLEVGQLVAVALREHTAPSRCYVGEIQAVDDHGIRLSLMDWIVGQCVGLDVFIMWDSIMSALVATDAHDASDFIKAAAAWQQAMQTKGAAP